MTKEEMVYALQALDDFTIVMRQEIIRNEEKGPWGKERLTDLAFGALENLKEILNTEDPMERVSSATHAAMYCFFIADNEVEGALKENEIEEDEMFPGLTEFMQGIIAETAVDAEGVLIPADLIDRLVRSNRIDIQCD